MGLERLGLARSHDAVKDAGVHQLVVESSGAVRRPRGSEAARLCNDLAGEGLSDWTTNSEHMDWVESSEMLDTMVGPIGTFPEMLAELDGL